MGFKSTEISKVLLGSRLIRGEGRGEQDVCGGDFPRPVCRGLPTAVDMQQERSRGGQARSIAKRGPGTLTEAGREPDCSSSSLGGVEARPGVGCGGGGHEIAGEGHSAPTPGGTRLHAFPTPPREEPHTG